MSSRPRPPARFWFRVAGALGAGAIVVAIVPRAADGGQGPPLGLLLAVGLLVSIATTGMLYAGLRLDLKLPASAAMFAVAYNVLVIVVKFVVSPAALYEVNRERSFESLWPIDRPFGAALAAGLVLALYAAGLWITYDFAKRRWLERASEGALGRRAMRIAGMILGIGIAVIAAGFPVAFAALAGLGYLAYVFSSTYAILMGVTLAGAVALAAQAFRGAAERQELVMATATIASLFWAGLAFLALYHVLWVVYILVLTSIWPLKVVVPK